MPDKKRYSVELDKGAEAELFRVLLKVGGYDYTASEAGSYIHFSMDLTENESDVTRYYLELLQVVQGKEVRR